MDLRGYLFRINQNNGFRLNPDEMKDVFQNVTIFLNKKDYNNGLTRNAARAYYKAAVNSKVTREQTAQELKYLDTGTAESDHEKEQRRRELIPDLNLNRIQKKVVDFLVKGFSYEEIRKKLKLNSKQLRALVYQIRTQNKGPQVA